MFYDKVDEDGERETPEQVFKIIIIGDSGVGKTCLAHRFATGKFPERTEATIGVDFWERKLQLNGANIRLQIWDTAGQERFRKSMVVHYYRNVSAVIFMYDITREGSFKALATWLDEYDHYGLSDGDIEVPKLMIGNKCDLVHERIVSSNQARKFADLHSMPMWEISTKNDEELETIESIFLTLSHKLVRSKSFMDRLPRYTSLESSVESTNSRTKSGKFRNSQKKIKLKNETGQQKKNCCESS